MEEKKIEEIRKVFAENPKLSADDVMMGYIFGPYGNNEHYVIDDIVAIKYALKNPEVVDES